MNRRGPVDEQASLRLLAGNSGVSSLAGARLAALTMGNPLALLELPRVLSLDDLSELVEPLPTTQLLQRAFAAPMASMSDRQRQALQVCAAAGNAELDVVARALGTLDSDLAALDRGTMRGLVQLTGRTVTFRHPLIRSAVYSQAGAGGAAAGARRAGRRVHVTGRRRPQGVAPRVRDRRAGRGGRRRVGGHRRASPAARRCRRAGRRAGTGRRADRRTGAAGQTDLCLRVGLADGRRA